MIKCYTVFVDDEPWINVIDDMNSTKDWAEGGMYWLDKSLAQQFADYHNKTGFPKFHGLFRVVEFTIP